MAGREIITQARRRQTGKADKCDDELNFDATNPTTQVLTPKMEALVRATSGAAALVKINVDDHPAISDQLRIQSLPTVMLMVQGRFVDTFKGVLPDDQLAAFVNKAVATAAASSKGVAGGDAGGPSGSGGPGETAGAAPPSPPVQQDPAVLVEGAFAALDSGAPGAKEAAARAFSHVLAADNTAAAAVGPALKAKAYAGVARCALLASPPDVEGAREMIAAARKTVDNNFTEPDEIGAAAARIELVSGAMEAGVLTFNNGEGDGGNGNNNKIGGDGGQDDGGGQAIVETLRGEVEAAAASGDKDAADDARKKLALRLVFAGDAEGAVDVALEMVKKGNRERGRELCVQIFDALGAAHPLAHAGRRRLSNLWFI